MFEAGANYFILQVKPRLLIPMHYFHRTEIILDYVRTAGSRTTEVLAMPGIGDQILLDFDEEGFMTISFPRRDPDDSSEDEGIDHLEDNPFAESDLPLSQLSETDGEAPEDPSAV
jgi:hypothetical protein